MAIKVQRALGSALVRSPATPEAEAATKIPRRQHARRPFSSNCFRIQIHRTQVRMLFVCLLLISLLETEAMLMCGVPGRAENGTQISLYSAELYNPGQKTEYSCQPGLALHGGNSIRTCQNDGSWSGSRPRCVDNLAYKKAVASSRVVNHYRPDLIVDGNTRSCIYLDTRVDDRFIQIDLKKNYLISGLVIHVPDGYVQQLTVFIAEKLESAPGIQYRRCTPGISHINAPKLQIDCRGEHGSVAVPGRFLHIRDERQVHDFYFALCEIEIYGLPASPLSCGLPDLPAFATSVNQTQMLEEKHRNTFELTCQTGFILQGTKVLRCVDDGNWIGSEAAQCIAVECDPLDPLINGQIELFPTRGLNNNSFNSVARHICSEGFMIFGGDVTRTCGLDGRWTGTPPFCRATDCQLPRPILNAVYKLVDNHTKPGAIAQYTCSNGYVPQRILADKPLQTAIVCQQSGVWKEGNFYCALRTTYYPPVSISFSSTTEIPSEPTEELVPPGTLISTTAPEQTSLIQEIEFFQPVTISNVDLETTNVSVGTGNTNSSSSIVFGEEEASESTRSIGTAVAATGFIVVFIVVFLMVAIGITFNVCRMRTAFEKAKKRFLVASTNLLLINTSDSSTKEGVSNVDHESGERNKKHQVVAKLESEPVYNELDDPLRKQNFHVQSSPSTLSSEEESTYLDIDIDKDVKPERDSFQFCSENFSLQCDSYQNESSFIDSTRPSLTPDEILLLYAKVDKSKKKKNRIYSNGITTEPPTLESNGKVECNEGIENVAHEIDDSQKGHLNKSFSKFRDFHPKKVNDLQMPKTVVDVSLNEFFIEHSRIRYKETSKTLFQEGRPLPALPTREAKRKSQENESTPDHNEETNSQNIYATLPLPKST